MFTNPMLNSHLLVLVAFAILTFIHGAWRSLVARLHGVQEVMGSSPVAPTLLPAFLLGIKTNEKAFFLLFEVQMLHFALWT